MTMKHEFERISGYQDHQRYRIEAVREAVRYHGIQMGADPFRIEDACQEAEMAFMSDPSSGHRAIEHGRMWLERPTNVIPFRRRAEA